MKIRIGHLSTFYHTAILLMARGDGAAAVGADIDWRLFGTGPEIVNAFENGELDLAYIGLPPAIIGIARGVGIVCVAGGHMEGTVMAGRTRWKGFPELRGPETILRQFAGRKIGVPGKGSIHDVILRENLATAGLEQDVRVVNYPWADQVTEAMARGEIEAAFGTPALGVAIRHFAGGKLLMPASMLWPGNPSYGIVAGREFLHKHPETIRRFLFLHEEAEAMLRNDPRGASRMIAKETGVVDEAFVLETLRVSPRYCAQLTEGYIGSTLRFIGPLKRLGFITRDVSADEIFDLSVIKEVHPEKDHYGEGIREE